MVPPRSSKRRAKLQKVVAIIASCCAAVIIAFPPSSPTSLVIAMDVGSISSSSAPPPYRVWPANNNNNDNNTNSRRRQHTEERRRLEQDYYRHLYAASSESRSSSSSHRAVEEDDMASDNDNHHHRRQRRLGGTTMTNIHKKDNDNNNNNNAEENAKNEVNQMAYMLLGGGDGESSETTETETETETEEEEEEEDIPIEKIAATDLRKFTRMGDSTSTSSSSFSIIPTSTKYPYMASLQLEGHSPTSGNYDIHMCGAVLVAPDIFLTAAHCAKYTPEGTTTDGETYQAFNGIEIGKVDLLNEGPPHDPYSLETYKLSYENLIPDTLHVHPRYDEASYEHDVMLIKIHGISRYPPVKLTQYEPSSSTTTTVTAIGWGAKSAAQSTTQRYSNQLTSTSLNIMSLEECRDRNVFVQDPITNEVSTMSLRDHIYDDMVCGANDDDDRDRYICYGDAGGPAIINNNSDQDDDDEDEVYGILSWGYGCVDHNYPAVLTKVSVHYDWIRTMICNESSDPPSHYGCFPPGVMSEMSGTSSNNKETVTLKLKLDKMAVETGFVIETIDGSATSRIVAQRQIGWYKSEGNEIIIEAMDIPSDTCYKLIVLDSYGDGFCCNMGGGSARLYRGRDVGYYTGMLLVEVSGQFEFENSGEFCLGLASLPMSSSSSSSSSSGSGVGSGAENISSYTHDKSTPIVSQPLPPPPPPPVPPPPPTPTPPPSPEKEEPIPQQNVVLDVSGGIASDATTQETSSSLHWSGPVTNPEYEYCTQFCSSSSNGMMCGSHECVHTHTTHTTSDVVTSDSDQEEGDDNAPKNNNNVGTISLGGKGGGSAAATAQSQEEETKEEAIVASDTTTTQPLTSTQFYDENSKYYITVQFQFDGNPQEISWVLYDLTENEVQVFVDFDEYPQVTYANRMLTLQVTMDGPGMGEKQYAFTVYDNKSNGLCCEYGEGYYKVFLGDMEDNVELLGDDNFDFSSSYYFTLFENDHDDDDGDADEQDETYSPTTKPPSMKPSHGPTNVLPTNPPSNPPTEEPTSKPTTAKPSQVWERTRQEDVSDIGARWYTRTKTLPGVFNDVGGSEQHNMDGSSRIRGYSNSAPRRHGYSATRISLVTGIVSTICLFVAYIP